MYVVAGTLGELQYRSELSEPKTRVLNEPLTR